MEWGWSKFLSNNQQLEEGHESLIKGKMKLNYYNKVLKTKRDLPIFSNKNKSAFLINF